MVCVLARPVRPHLACSPGACDQSAREHAGRGIVLMLAHATSPHAARVAGSFKELGSRYPGAVSTPGDAGRALELDGYGGSMDLAQSGCAARSWQSLTRLLSAPSRREARPIIGR